MPLPVIIAGLAAVGAAALGVGAQVDAKETNERAKSLAIDAQSLYEDAKHSLDIAQEKTEYSLLNLGNAKKRVLETSMNQFLVAYDRIKNIEMSKSTGPDEIKKFSLEKQDAIQLREMSDIYESTFSSGVAGVATGAIVALAVSGSLPVVTGTLSIAGSALVAGEIGIATGLAGSALSFGAAMTPLTAIAAPVVLFTGISASIKAEENLEKARTMYAEAEAASEKMKTAEVLCIAISDKADMYNNLLGELNAMFSYCTGMLDGVTRKKMRGFKNRTVDARKFTEEELKLVAVTRSLAGAVKAVIDTPILTEKGAISSESANVYEDVIGKLPAFIEAVDQVKSTHYSMKPIVTADSKLSQSEKAGSILGTARNIIATIAGLFIAIFMQYMITDTAAIGPLAFATITLLIMDNDVTTGFFKLVKNIGCFFFGAGFCLLFWDTCETIVYMDYYIWGLIIAGFISTIMCGICIPEKGKKTGNFKRMMARLFGCILFFIIAILVYAFLHKFINISHIISAIITVILYAPFALTFAYIEE